MVINPLVASFRIPVVPRSLPMAAGLGSFPDAFHADVSEPLAKRVLHFFLVKVSKWPATNPNDDLDKP